MRYTNLDLIAENRLRKLRRVIHKLNGPEGYYLLEQYNSEIYNYLNQGDYDSILKLKLNYDYMEMPIRTLRDICKTYGIPYYKTLSRYELVRAIQNVSTGNITLNQQ